MRPDGRVARKRDDDQGGDRGDGGERDDERAG
jgi:hypothetical protein